MAKNLQSKPELAEISALEIDDNDDVIDGSDLPVGDHAKQGSSPTSSDDDAIVAAAASAALAEPPKAGEPLKKAKPRKGMKVPNFNSFRKKLIIGIVALLALIAFLIWAIFIAPHATVVVSTKTSDMSVNTPLDASQGNETSAKKGTIKALLAKDSEDKTVDFTATGTKNVGEKATGTVEFSTDSITNLGTTIPAGTKLTSSSGLVFITDSSVTMTIDNYNGAPTGVTASERGAKYNAASGTMSGAPNGISARLTGPTSGGTDKTVKVVTAGDVQRAKESLVAEDTKDVQKSLHDSFDGKVNVLDDSFNADYTAVTATPDVGAEAPNSKAVLTSTVKYSLYAIEEDEISTFIDKYLKQELGDHTDRRVYSNGADDVTLQDVKKTKDGAKLTLVATAKVGPKLKETDIKDKTRGKKFGEIQATIESIQGVENVEVKFTPFWLNTVPKDTKRITVEFKVDDKK